MFISKRPIYNASLKKVASEIKIHDTAQQSQDNTHNIERLVGLEEQQLPLFLPHALDKSIEVKRKGDIVLTLFDAQLEAKNIEYHIEHANLPIALMVSKDTSLAFSNAVDFLGVSNQMIEANTLASAISNTRVRPKLFAYEVDSTVLFKKALNQGCEYFCGDFLYQPNPEQDTSLVGSKLNLISLVNLLCNEEVEFEEVVKKINQDPGLSYALLRLVNSAALSGSTEIESIQQAVVRLGLVNLKHWVIMLSMKEVSSKPIDVIESGLIRAEMCQRLAQSHDIDDTDKLYSLGLLSIIDTLLDCPMHKLLSKTSLHQSMKEALIHRQGILGEILSTVIDYEKGHWAEVADMNDNMQGLCAIYIDSLDKACQTLKAI